jgi:hypothetical protein
MSELIKKENTDIAIHNPMSLVQSAIEKGLDVEALTKLMDLQERWESNQAKKEYFHAFNHFQTTVPAIKKLKTGHNCMYAPLGDIAEQIKPSLQECDLSYRFEQDHSNGVTVTCIVSHVSGHSERTTMTAPPDTSGKKNPIQSIASAVTYLQRYTLISALGITTADEDTDGRLAISNGDFLGGEQLAEIEKLLNDSGANRDKFLQFFNVNQVSDLPTTSYARARNMLKSKIKA